MALPQSKLYKDSQGEKSKPSLPLASLHLVALSPSFHYIVSLDCKTFSKSLVLEATLLLTSNVICQEGRGVLRKGTGTQITLRKTKSLCGRKRGLRGSLPTSPVSARFHSISFHDEPHCFWQVTRQSQIKITSITPTPAGSALTETGSSWFSKQWKGIRTSLTYCWEGRGCACSSGQPWSITAVLPAEPSVEGRMAKSCFHVLLWYRRSTVAAPVF